MPDTLFTKIIARQIPAKIAYEDDRYIAIHDISPQAPVHLLVIPKKVIPTLNDLTEEDTQLVGGLFLVAKKLMGEMGRAETMVFNCGPGAVGVSHSSACASGSQFQLAPRIEYR